MLVFVLFALVFCVSVRAVATGGKPNTVCLCACLCVPLCVCVLLLYVRGNQECGGIGNSVAMCSGIDELIFSPYLFVELLKWLLVYLKYSNIVSLNSLFLC